MELTQHLNEQRAKRAFSRQSLIFDELYAGNTIVRYKRDRVRSHAMQYLKPASSILELNSGTGQDALFFAGQGHHVHATDISEGMQQQLRSKVLAAGRQEWVSNELCSFTQLDQLKQKGPYDMIFSNFAGLNCTGELDKALLSFHALLKAGGIITLVVLPKCCLWESLLLLKGKLRTATRRWFSSKGRKAHVEGVHFRCWYYSPSYIINILKNDYELLSLEGLCTIVPPSYIEGFAEKHPAVYRRLVTWENKLKFKRPWRSIGDYYIISLRKNT